MAIHDARKYDGPKLEERAAALRRFNRFYTRQIGVLNEGLLQGPFSLTEARVLYELFHREGVTAAELARDLGLDRSYLSRLLGSFQRSGLVARQPSGSDRRRLFLRLTGEGKQAFTLINAAAQEEAEEVLARLPESKQACLVAAMTAVEGLLGSPVEARTAYVLRPPRPGDMGWVVSRHGALYAQEYGWDEQFEALVAEIVAQFLRTFDPKRERCWIAECEGEAVGSVFVVRHSEEEARLRLLLVEPSARGLGIGKRLVAECVEFARRSGYRRVTLWTNDVLSGARHLYEQAGFYLTNEGPHHSFGQDLVEQTWQLML